MKKRSILISVLVGLVLAFGVLIASCDNGVLPKYERKFDQIEWELEDSGYPYTDWSGDEGPIGIGIGPTDPVVLGE